MTYEEILAELEFAIGIIYETRYPRRRMTVKAIQQLVAMLKRFEPEVREHLSYMVGDGDFDE